jgi:hypothetical protein
MKKLFFIAPLLLCLNGFGQTLSLQEVLNLPNLKDVKSFLTAKSFEQTSQDVNFQVYLLNKGTNKQEKLVYTPQRVAVAYSTSNLDYLNSMVQQAQKQLQLVTKNDNESAAFYQFSDANFNIMININKLKGSGTVGVAKK